MNKLMAPYGLQVANVTVPNVSLPEEVKCLLDAITKSRLETEKARQQATLAKLEVSRLKAERGRIQAEKVNNLLAAQKDLAINQPKADAALENAHAGLANANLFSANPNYLTYQMAVANTAALTKNDKLILLQPGMFPNLVFGSQGVPTILLPTGSTTSTINIP